MKTKSTNKTRNRCCEVLKDTSVIYLDKSLVMESRFKYVPFWAVILSLVFSGFFLYYLKVLCDKYHNVINFDEITEDRDQNLLNSAEAKDDWELIKFDLSVDGMEKPCDKL